jgi:hypothetical protein
MATTPRAYGLAQRLHEAPSAKAAKVAAPAMMVTSKVPSVLMPTPPAASAAA